jgi:hypothetical protein
VEEQESDCGVHVENILQEVLDAGKVQKPNELLMVSVRCVFVHDVIQSLHLNEPLLVALVLYGMSHSFNPLMYYMLPKVYLIKNKLSCFMCFEVILYVCCRYFVSSWN